MLKEISKVCSVGAAVGILLGFVGLMFIEPTTPQGNLLVIFIATLIGAILGVGTRAIIRRRKKSGA